MEQSAFVSRGGLKLAHALEVFDVRPEGWVCVDLGASTGGFTDCLLQRGAVRVYAIDTAYGQLAWTLRTNPRVVVMERTNVLHAAPQPDFAGARLVVADLGWTPQRLLAPAALRWLAPGGRIISLVKPHYERRAGDPPLAKGGVLADADAERITQRTIDELPALGVAVLGLTLSPIRGGKQPDKPAAGNAEWLVLLERAGSA